MIAFCVPWYSEWNTVKKSILPICKGKPKFTLSEYEIKLQACRTPYVGMVRNIFIAGSFAIDIKKPKLRNFDRWVFCDSDIGFTRDDLLRVLDSDKDIVSLPYRLNSKHKVYNAKIGGEHVPLSTKGLQKVEGCGAGGLLTVKRKVFEKVPPYWFFIDRSITNGVLDWIPEDYNFCLKARAAGFDVWVDFDHPLTHNNPNLSS